MGVVNVTPDSFSDGGLYLDPEAAIAHGEELAAGRGGRSWTSAGNRLGPGRRRSSAEEELARVVPVVDGAGRRRGDAVSIDTSKAAVAEAALDAGAEIVNDVTALRGDPEMAALCAERGAGLVLMHMQGTPRTMQEDPVYDDVVDEVKAFLAERMEVAVVGRGRRGADLARPRDRVRQDARAQPGAAAAARGAARAGPAAGRRHLAQELHRQGRRLARRASGSAARSPPRSSPPPRAPTCCASTTSPRSAQAISGRRRAILG